MHKYSLSTQSIDSPKGLQDADNSLSNHSPSKATVVKGQTPEEREHVMLCWSTRYVMLG